jgi:iron complex outermembrane receptor protein
MYYDGTRRSDFMIQENRDTADIDVQHRFSSGNHHDIVWGLGYRITWDRIGNSPIISVDPCEKRTGLISAFIQDEITLVKERLRLTV